MLFRNKQSEVETLNLKLEHTAHIDVGLSDIGNIQLKLNQYDVGPYGPPIVDMTKAETVNLILILQRAIEKQNIFEDSKKTFRVVV
jgi:hypothetical protein